MDEHLAGSFEPLADELCSRPGPDEMQDAVGKIVDAAQHDVTTQLGSLEESVLTLAEALLRRRAARCQARVRAAVPSGVRRGFTGIRVSSPALG